MHKISRFICKHHKLILIIALILLIPAYFGYKATRINYDILTYLPNDVETIKGENILKSDFGIGGYTVIVVEHMSNKDIAKLEDQIRDLDNVNAVGSAVDIIGTEYPREMLPDDIKDKLFKDDTTLIMATFKDSLSSDRTLDTIKKLRQITDKRCKISGMSAVVLDTKEISDSEVATYVVIAVILCLIILQLALDSYFAPFLLLANIGIAIIYNMGSNIMLGEISYITKAISAVLQLGVTMDFAIFLYDSYIQEKAHIKDDEEAMATAIDKTFVSVLGSSLTTIAGFLALCSMRLTIGKDIGIVMAKGVLFGVICVVTVLPALVLTFRKLVQKTHHKRAIPQFKKLKDFIIKHHRWAIVVYLVLLPIAFYGYSHTNVYYNLTGSLPKSLPSIQANQELKDKYNMVSTQMILVDKNMSAKKVNDMTDEIEALNGIDWTLSGSKLDKVGIPSVMIPDEIKDKLQSDKYQLILANSTYESATDKLNSQLDQVKKIIKKYDKNAILAGEGALTKDLVEISAKDFNSVNTVSIAVIFIIMLFVLRSIALPVILICVIQLAIFINMSVPFYTNTTIPFIASIVIGTIQLGATIDYAILITNKYISQRKSGKTKLQAVDYAIGTSISSIFVSGLCFFGATFGVGVVSKISMIGSLCTLMSRGALISVTVVACMLPAFLLLFDKVICKTTKGMRAIKA